MSWYLNRFSRDQIDNIANNPRNFDTGDVRRAAKEAEQHYMNDTYGCTIEWMTTVQMKLNAELRRRGESPV